MKDAPVTRKGDMIVLGDDQVRIEEGPAYRTAVATAELLHDDNTASHYYAGVRPMRLNTPKGPVEVPAEGRDALAKPIRIGEEMTYLDHGGLAAPGSRCFHIYQKRPVDPTKEKYDDGTPNPHYVPEHVRAGALLADDGTPPNRTHYEYVFEPVDTVSIPPDADEDARKAAEDQAIARGQELLAASKE